MRSDRAQCGGVEQPGLRHTADAFRVAAFHDEQVPVCGAPGHLDELGVFGQGERGVVVQPEANVAREIHGPDQFEAGPFPSHDRDRSAAAGEQRGEVGVIEEVAARQDHERLVRIVG